MLWSYFIISPNTLQMCELKITATAPVTGKTWRKTNLIGAVSSSVRAKTDPFTASEEAPEIEAGPGKKPKAPGHSDARVCCFARDNNKVSNRSDMPFIG